MKSKEFLISTGASLALTMALALGSCSDTPGIDKQKFNDTDASDYYTTEEICDIALNARTSFYGAESRTSISVANVTPLKKSLKSRADEEKNLLYVVNFEDEKGFALVSSAKDHNCLYAVTDYGNYNLETNDNIGLQDYMSRAQAYANSIESDITPIKPPRFKYLEIIYDTLSYRNLAPQVKVQWGQQSPYNMNIYINVNGELKNPPAGCGPIGFAQALTYFEFPTSITRKAQTNKGEKLILDWSKIKQHIRCGNTNALKICPNDGHHSIISDLINEIGLSTNIKYSMDGSSTFIENTRKYALSLGFTVSDVADYQSGIPGMSNGEIIIVSGLNDAHTKSHSFIIDGEKSYIINVTENIYDMGPGGTATEGTLISSTTKRTSAKYVHINWGANGFANGYYYDKVFDSSKIHTYDEEDRAIKNDTQHFSYKESLRSFKMSLK